ncbi:MAG: hypothetical protein AAF495_28400 [Pseudomonadota bacterium]
MPPKETTPAPRDDWTEPEKWVWSEIRAGRVADFNKRDGRAEHNPLDSCSNDGWNETRKLRSVFLAAILFEEPYKIATPYRGVRIVGAWFSESVDVSHGKTRIDMWLDNSRFDGPVNFDGLRVDGWLSLDGSTFNSSVTMNNLLVAGHLILRDKATFRHGLNLIGAKIETELSMTESLFEGTVNLNDLEVGHNLNLSNKAHFKERLLLANAKIGKQLSLAGSIFEQSVKADGLRVQNGISMNNGATFIHDLILRGVRVGGQVNMSTSTFHKSINLNGSIVERGVFMGEGTRIHGDIDLTGAHVGGQLLMTSSVFEGRIDMSGLSVAGDLFMSEESIFRDEIHLRAASVQGQVATIGSTFESDVYMESLVVSGSLLMRGMKEFRGKLDLNSARVRGQLSMIGSVFQGAIEMDGIVIEGAVFIREAGFSAPIRLVFGKLGEDLDISGSRLAGLDLTGTRVSAEFRLGSHDHDRTLWRDGAQLTLRNAQVGAIQDRIDKTGDSWPTQDNLLLDGFDYEQLGGYEGSGESADMMARPVSWFVDWLARNSSQSPQPYEQLASVFDTAGYSAKATAIRYAARERRRRRLMVVVEKDAKLPQRVTTRLTSIGLWLLKATIGYGLGGRYFRALIWVCGFTLLGASLLSLASSMERYVPSHSIWWNLACSLDMLLPIVELNKAHAEFISEKVAVFPSTAWIAYYFYAHKLVGWVLASFLVAGLAGLTQK